MANPNRSSGYNPSTGRSSSSFNAANAVSNSAIHGTQPNAYSKAQQTTSTVMGTYSGHPRNESQDWHDKAFKTARDNVKKERPYLKNLNGKDSPATDRDAARKVLQIGGEPQKLQNSVANHSPYLKQRHGSDMGKRHHDAGKIVANAHAKNLKNEPFREERQNVKPGHETSIGPDSKQNKEHLAAWQHYQNRSR